MIMLQKAIRHFSIKFSNVIIGGREIDINLNISDFCLVGIQIMSTSLFQLVLI